jgi:hypothetical protein
MRVFPDQKNGGQYALPAIGFEMLVEVSWFNTLGF